MEELIDNLELEEQAYKKLLSLSMEKTPVIVSADLESLQRITDDEQEIVIRINALDKKRDMNMKDIANVINKDVDSLKLTDLIDMLNARPVERNRLASIYDKLRDTLAQMRTVNEQNRQLIASSLEMVEFDLNVLQAYKSAPQTANYNRNAYNAGTVVGGNTGAFDAKQ
ncbi:MAG: flagellar protein FlgN [Lachnospiraceae bacterium]|nr:flagellar protein FlgN [Candidatus Colinaster equi]